MSDLEKILLKEQDAFAMHSHEKAIAAISGNICRCTGYKSIEKAAVSISKLLK